MSNLYRDLPVQAFFSGGYDSFQIFLKHGKNYTLYKDRGRRLGLDDRARLDRAGVTKLYIRAGEAEEINRYNEDNLKQALSDPNLNSKEKMEILFHTSVNYMAEIFEHPNELNADRRDRSINLIQYILENSMSIKDIVEILGKLVDHNYYEYTHGIHVASVAVSISDKFYGLHHDELIDVGVGCLLHDIGKVHIPNSILTKPGKLTHEEMQLVREHPVTGYNMLYNSGTFEPQVLEIVRHHHEKDDGTGYPDKIVGSSLGRNAKVAVIADVFCALISKRSYREALPKREAIRIMREEMNGFFDMELFEEFDRNISLCFPEGSDEEIKVPKD